MQALQSIGDLVMKMHWISKISGELNERKKSLAED
jgi:hypothetical protein